MSILRATAVLNHRSGVPNDASRNVWHFDVPDVSSTTLATVGTAVETFYQGLSTVLSPAIGTQNHRVEMATVFQNLEGAADDVVSALLATRAFSIPAGTTAGGGMPNEVAVALSFRGAIAGVPEEAADGLERPRSRRRGRIFLGPLKVTVAEATDPNYEPQVTVAARESILDAYDQLHDILFAANPNIQHVVYSRVDAEPYVVESVSVDDEFDTVRRRGQKPGRKMTREVTVGAAHGSRSGVDSVLAA